MTGGVDSPHQLEIIFSNQAGQSVRGRTAVHCARSLLQVVGIRISVSRAWRVHTIVTMSARHPINVLRQRCPRPCLAVLRRRDTGALCWILVDHESVLLGWDGWLARIPDYEDPPVEVQRRQRAHVEKYPHLDPWDPTWEVLLEYVRSWPT